MAKANRRLYLARFEIGQYGQGLQFPDAILQKAKGKGTVAGWIYFMVGFPVACIELQALVGEISSRSDLQNNLVESVASDGAVSPTFPKTLFGGYADQKLLMNLIYLDNDYSEFMAKDLEGEPKPQGLHWWLNTNLMTAINGTPSKWPYPGEFIALAVRLFVDRYWDSQESNPFLYSGNWADTIFFSGGFIKEIGDPTAEEPWPHYTVQWHTDPKNNAGVIKNVRPSDFSTYQVGDRVVILKDITTTKPSQLWKDPDMTVFGGDNDNWQICPLSFYGIDPNKSTS